ncbi:hypothetical protein MGH68_16205 [Erysipelothrix sp. D19-032]
MTPNIKTTVVGEVCDRIQDMLFTTIEEEPNKFPTLRVTDSLLESFSEKGLDLNINSFTDSFMDKLYEEVRTYLSKSYSSEE